MKTYNSTLRYLLITLFLLCVSGVWGEEVTYSFTIQTSDFVTTSYAANNGSHSSTAVCTTDDTKTKTIEWTSNQIYQNSSSMQWQKSNGYIYNTTDLESIESVVVYSTAGSFTTYYGINEHPTSGTTVGNGYFTVKTGNSATGMTSSIVVTFKVNEGSADTRTAVNMSTFTTAGGVTSIVKGNTLATSVTNDQSGWTAAYTYSSSNESVATVAADGTITAVAKGTAKIKASLNVSNSDASYKAGTTTYKEINITVTNPSHHYTFSANGTTFREGDVEEGEAIPFPVTKPAGVYGKTFVGWYAGDYSNATTAPSYVTKATMGENDVTYKAVYATASGTGEKTWSKITYASDIVNGVYAIISFDEAYYLPNATATGNCPSTSEVPKRDGKIEINDAMKWNLTITDGKINLESVSNNGNYLWGGSANDAIRVNQNSTKADATKIWYVKRSENYGLVLYNKSTQDGQLLTTYTNKDWRNYTTSSATNRAANLYKLENEYTYSNFCTIVPSSATITLNAACTDGSLVYGTYSNSSAWVVPSDLEVSVIAVDGNALFVEAFKTGNVVPANTGVMVSALEGGRYTVNLSNEAGVDPLEGAYDNALRPTGAGITSTAMAAADANCLYYRLTMHDGDKIGFWWGAADGAAFELAANKAYLAVPKGSEVKTSFWFDEETEDAIGRIENGELKIENGTFGNGRNVFLENGKLVIIKNGKKFNVAGQRIK